MRFKVIKNLVELVSESDIGVLEVSSFFSCIRINHSQRKSLVLEKRPRIKIEYSSCAELRSNHIGIFYWTESKKGRPSIRKGKLVHRGDTLGYIDTLSVMVEVRSDYNGVLRRVFVKRKDKVEYGTPLFGIELNELRNP
jgi:biotin carboxyl carrier protein